MHDAYTYTENNESDCKSRHRHDIFKLGCKTHSAFHHNRPHKSITSAQ